MTIGSLPIALSELSTEFGGAAPHAMSEYYRGGAFVPNIAENAAIPTAGAIILSSFVGGQKSVLFTITEGSDTLGTGSPAYGFSTGWFSDPIAMGAKDHANVNGQAFEEIYWLNSNDGAAFDAISISIGGILPQSFFTSVTIEGVGTLTSASVISFVTYTTGQFGPGLPYRNGSVWNWQPQAASGWDGSGTRTVRFHF